MPVCLIRITECWGRSLNAFAFDCSGGFHVGYHDVWQWGVQRVQFSFSHSVLRTIIHEPIIYFRKASCLPVNETENGRCWVRMHAGTLSKRAERLRPESRNVSSGRVINDQYCIWVSFSGLESLELGGLTLPSFVL